MNEFYIYAYYEHGQETPFYIGKGKGNRFNIHLYLCNDLTRRTHFYNKLRKIFQTGFPIIQKLHENLTEKQAIDYEIKLIAKYGRIDLGTGCLCNHTDGGEGISGYVPTEETIEKLKHRNGYLGYKHTTDTKIKISIANSKKKRTKQQITEMRNNRIKTQGIPVCSYDLITNQIIKKYTHIRAVKEDGYTPTNVSAVINGKVRSHSGLGWRHLLASEIVA